MTNQYTLPPGSANHPNRGGLPRSFGETPSQRLDFLINQFLPQARAEGLLPPVGTGASLMNRYVPFTQGYSEHRHIPTVPPPPWAGVDFRRKWAQPTFMPEMTPQGTIPVQGFERGGMAPVPGATRNINVPFPSGYAGDGTGTFREGIGSLAGSFTPWLPKGWGPEGVSQGTMVERIRRGVDAFKTSQTEPIVQPPDWIPGFMQPSEDQLALSRRMGAFVGGAFRPELEGLEDWVASLATTKGPDRDAFPEALRPAFEKIGRPAFDAATKVSNIGPLSLKLGVFDPAAETDPVQQALEGGAGSSWNPFYHQETHEIAKALEAAGVDSTAARKAAWEQADVPFGRRVITELFDPFILGPTLLRKLGILGRAALPITMRGTNAAADAYRAANAWRAKRGQHNIIFPDPKAQAMRPQGASFKDVTSDMFERLTYPAGRGFPPNAAAYPNPAYSRGLPVRFYNEPPTAPRVPPLSKSEEATGTIDPEIMEAATRDQYPVIKEYWAPKEGVPSPAWMRKIEEASLPLAERTQTTPDEALQLGMGPKRTTDELLRLGGYNRSDTERRLEWSVDRAGVNLQRNLAGALEDPLSRAAETLFEVRGYSLTDLEDRLNVSFIRKEVGQTDITNNIEAIRKIIPEDKPSGGWKPVARKLQKAIEGNRDKYNPSLIEGLDNLETELDQFIDLDTTGMSPVDRAEELDAAMFSLQEALYGMEPNLRVLGDLDDIRQLDIPATVKMLRDNAEKMDRSNIEATARIEDEDLAKQGEALERAIAEHGLYGETPREMSPYEMRFTGEMSPEELRTRDAQREVEAILLQGYPTREEVMNGAAEHVARTYDSSGTSDMEAMLMNKMAMESIYKGIIPANVRKNPVKNAKAREEVREMAIDSAPNKAMAKIYLKFRSKLFDDQIKARVLQDAVYSDYTPEQLREIVGSDKDLLSFIYLNESAAMFETLSYVDYFMDYKVIPQLGLKEGDAPGLAGNPGVTEENIARVLQKRHWETLLKFPDGTPNMPARDLPFPVDPNTGEELKVIFKSRKPSTDEQLLDDAEDMIAPFEEWEIAIREEIGPDAFRRLEQVVEDIAELWKIERQLLVASGRKSQAWADRMEELYPYWNPIVYAEYITNPDAPLQGISHAFGAVRNYKPDAKAMGALSPLDPEVLVRKLAQNRYVRDANAAQSALFYLTNEAGAGTPGAEALNLAVDVSEKFERWVDATDKFGKKIIDPVTKKPKKSKQLLPVPNDPENSRGYGISWKLDENGIEQRTVWGGRGTEETQAAGKLDDMSFSGSKPGDPYSDSGKKTGANVLPKELYDIIYSPGGLGHGAGYGSTASAGAKESGLKQVIQGVMQIKRNSLTIYDPVFWTKNFIYDAVLTNMLNYGIGPGAAFHRLLQSLNPMKWDSQFVKDPKGAAEKLFDDPKGTIQGFLRDKEARKDDLAKRTEFLMKNTGAWMSTYAGRTSKNKMVSEMEEVMKQSGMDGMVAWLDGSTGKAADNWRLKMSKFAMGAFTESSLGNLPVIGKPVDKSLKTISQIMGGTQEVGTRAEMSNRGEIFSRAADHGLGVAEDFGGVSEYLRIMKLPWEEFQYQALVNYRNTGTPLIKHHAIRKAAMHAIEEPINFRRGGELIKKLNPYTYFVNVSTQAVQKRFGRDMGIDIWPKFEVMRNPKTNEDIFGMGSIRPHISGMLPKILGGEERRGQTGRMFDLDLSTRYPSVDKSRWGFGETAKDIGRHFAGRPDPRVAPDFTQERSRQAVPGAGVMKQEEGEDLITSLHSMKEGPWRGAEGQARERSKRAAAGVSIGVMLMHELARYLWNTHHGDEWGYDEVPARLKYGSGFWLLPPKKDPETGEYKRNANGRIIPNGISIIPMHRELTAYSAVIALALEDWKAVTDKDIENKRYTKAERDIVFKTMLKETSPVPHSSITGLLDGVERVTGIGVLENDDLGEGDIMADILSIFPIVGELTEQMANRNSYFEKELVPTYLTDKPQELQYTEGTSPLAVELAEGLSKTPAPEWSKNPSKLDHIFNSMVPMGNHLTTLGDYAYALLKEVKGIFDASELTTPEQWVEHRRDLKTSSDRKAFDRQILATYGSGKYTEYQDILRKPATDVWKIPYFNRAMKAFLPSYGDQEIFGGVKERTDAIRNQEFPDLNEEETKKIANDLHAISLSVADGQIALDAKFKLWLKDPSDPNGIDIESWVNLTQKGQGRYKEFEKAMQDIAQYKTKDTRALQELSEDEKEAYFSAQLDAVSGSSKDNDEYRLDFLKWAWYSIDYPETGKGKPGHREEVNEFYKNRRILLDQIKGRYSEELVAEFIAATSPAMELDEKGNNVYSLRGQHRLAREAFVPYFSIGEENLDPVINGQRFHLFYQNGEREIWQEYLKLPYKDRAVAREEGQNRSLLTKINGLVWKARKDYVTSTIGPNGVSELDEQLALWEGDWYWPPLTKQGHNIILKYYKGTNKRIGTQTGSYEVPLPSHNIPSLPGVGGGGMQSPTPIPPPVAPPIPNMRLQPQRSLY